MTELREILLTLSPAQRDELDRDLEVLREHGAEANTAAVLEAVRKQADSLRAKRPRRAT